MAMAQLRQDTNDNELMITREIAFVQGCGLAVNKLSHGAYMKRVHILLLFILQIQMTLKCSVWRLLSMNGLPPYWWSHVGVSAGWHERLLFCWL